jgi:predicted hotdog family 3-hydroxylacyl-ACP dehydratase|tara:strand:- start:248 stop:484 length:237 start_codon:yes stop_codon:yes gene_type:complete
MKNNETTNWDLLLSRRQNQATMKRFATGKLTTTAVTKQFQNTEYAGEFRRLIRNNGTTYARRLARKALRYRGILQPSS